MLKQRDGNSGDTSNKAKKKAALSKSGTAAAAAEALKQLDNEALEKAQAKAAKAIAKERERFACCGCCRR